MRAWQASVRGWSGVAVLLISLLTGLLVWLLLWGPGSSTSDSERSDQGVASADTELVWEDCEQSLPAGVIARCAWFETEADSGQPLRLPLVKLRRDGEAEHAPLSIHLPGGPGAPGGTGADSVWLWGAWMLSHRFPGRLLVFDPRGTGRAEPALACPGREHRVADILARPLAPDEEARASLAMLEDCRAELRAAGLEPADFAAHHVLEDVPAIMNAMGEHQARLIGLSHGSRLALALLRQSPERFSAALLDGVFPPEQDPITILPSMHRESLAYLLDHCRAQADCAPEALEAAFDAVRARLESEPVLLNYTLPDWEAPRPYWMDARRFADLVFSTQSLDEGLAGLPEAIHAAEAGDYAGFAALMVHALAPALNPDRNDPVYWASLCAEAGTPDPEALAKAGEGLSEGQWAYHPCLNGWRDQPLEEGFREPVSVDQPVLLLAAEHDPVTPVRWAREQAERLPKGHLLLVRGRSHGLIFDEDCAIDAAMRFLRDPRDASLPEECPRPDEP